jgi:Antirestriction protein
MKPNSTTKQGISALPVPENRRLNFLPNMFGRLPMYFLGGESMIYDFAQSLMDGYIGGNWTFCKAANGAHFATPPAREQWTVSVAGNGNIVEVSTEAAGVIVSLFALGAMAERAHGRGDGQGLDFLADRYYELREFAKAHPEARAIMKAID